jgi:hypothetical protein
MCGIRQARYSAAATGCAAAPGAGCCPYGTSQYSESEQAPTLKPNSHTTSQVGSDEGIWKLVAAGREGRWTAWKA